MKKVKKFAVMLILSSVIASGCGAEAETPIPSASPEPVTEAEPVKAVRGGTMKLSMRAPVTLNPLLNEDATVDNILKLVFHPLAELNNQQKPVPKLAESLNFASDGTSVIVTLRDDIFWADGEKITSKDLVYSLETLKNAPERGIYKAGVSNVLSFSAMDERNVKINYIQPFGGSAYFLCFPIIPQHFYKTAEPTDLLGSGLYEAASFDTKEGLKLTASKTALGGEAYIRNIEVKITSDAETDLYSFEQDMTDVVATHLVNWSRYINTTDASVTERQTTYFDFIGFNFQNPVLQDLNVRKAIAASLDRELILTQAYLGHGSVANAPVNPESWLYNNDTAPNEFNLDKAAEYLKNTEILSAGSIGILVNEENDERMKIASMLAENLTQLGVKAKIESAGFDEYQSRLTGGDFDLVVAGFNLSVMPELGFAFSSSPERGTQNYFSYSNEEMDMVLNRVLLSTTEDGYKAALRDMQTLFANDLPCVSLVFRKSVLLTDKRIHGEKTPSVSNMFYGMENWFITES